MADPGHAAACSAARRVLFALCVLLAAGCATATRPPPVPVGGPLVLPWGAWPPDEMREVREERLESELASGTVERIVARLERDEHGRYVYPMLALSVGGARGAYGAGVLVGWTESGTRPVFEQVTAASAGAIMAVAAFVGPDYDWMLREMFTTVDFDAILRPKGPLAMLYSDSTVDRSAMEALIDRYITVELVDRVGAAFETGRVLYVGTVDLDDDEFVVWDMTAIAASDRPDRVAHFRRIILASSAIPGVFEPVYFDVEVGGETYGQMHVDGGVKELVFLRPFMVDFDPYLERAGIDPDALRPQLFVIMNDSFAREAAPVEPRFLDIVSASISAMYTANRVGSVASTYEIARRSDVEFRITAIPDDYAAIVGSADFDTDDMAQLFALGVERARSGALWLDRPPESSGIAVERRRVEF